MSNRGDSSPAPVPPQMPIYKDLALLQLAAIVFVLDQFSKYLVRALLDQFRSFPDEGFFRITHTFNTGSAFGMFQGQNTPLIFVSFVGIAVLAFIYRSQRNPTMLLRLSLGLQIGGAIGNLLDRIRMGHVTDFIDVGPWPVFNLADSSIVVGLILLAWLFLRPGGAGSPEAVLDAPSLAPDYIGDRRDGLGGYSWCPVCDGDMAPAPGGWRCTACGVREAIVQPAGPTIDATDINAAGGPPGLDGVSPDGAGVSGFEAGPEPDLEAGRPDAGRSEEHKA